MEDRTAVTPELTGIFGPDLLTDGIRGKLKELVQVLLEGEVEEALDAAKYVRSEVRAGYRNGTKPRTIHTSMGSVDLEMPRARLDRTQGGTEEWQSQLLPRFERRSRSLDETLLSMYFAGTNTRRVKRTLKPLLSEAPLGKNVVSRLVGRLAAHVEAWKGRSLGGEAYPYLYLDATNLKVRVFRKIRKVPVLVVLGVRESGQKEVLAMEPLVKETTSAWSLVIEDLVARGLLRPLLAVVDGNAGLRSALQAAWPGLALQRCTVHKVRNLQDHCPVDVYPQVKEDYDRIVEAKNEAEAKVAYQAFLGPMSDETLKPALVARTGRLELDQTREKLLELGLFTAAEELTGELSEAVQHNRSVHTVLDRLLEKEVKLRDERRIKTSLKLSNLPPGLTLGSFDFGFQPSIDRKQIETLATGAFIREHTTLLLQGPPGVGKTVGRRAV